MRIVEDTPDRLRIAGSVDWGYLAFGLAGIGVALAAILLRRHLAEGLTTALYVAIPSAGLGAFLFWAGLQGRHALTVVDRRLGTLTVRGLGGWQRDVEVALEDVLAVAPRDLEDPFEGAGVALAVETRRQGRVFLGRLAFRRTWTGRWFGYVEADRVEARVAETHEAAARRLRGFLGSGASSETA